VVYLKLSKIVEKYLEEYCRETQEDFENLIKLIDKIRNRIEEDKDLTNHPAILKRLDAFKKEFEERVRWTMMRYSDTEEDPICVSEATLQIDFYEKKLADLEKELGLVRDAGAEKKKRHRFRKDPWDDYPLPII
jgi:iron-sulfur cluster repair protein YtfE (RIC family)